VPREGQRERFIEDTFRESLAVVEGDDFVASANGHDRSGSVQSMMKVTKEVNSDGDDEDEKKKKQAAEAAEAKKKQ
jgi:hypothetical protein